MPAITRLRPSLLLCQRLAESRELRTATRRGCSSRQMLHSSSWRAALRGGVMPARLCCAGGSASSAAGSAASFVCRFMTATRGGWSGSPVFGAFAKGPSARAFLQVTGRGSTHDGVEQERGVPRHNQRAGLHPQRSADDGATAGLVEEGNGDVRVELAQLDVGASKTCRLCFA